MQIVRKLVSPHGLIIGFTLTFFSFLAWNLSPEKQSFWILSIFMTSFALGTIFICDFIDYKISGSSILLNKKKSRLFINFGIPAIFAGLLIDFYAQWLAKFWSFNDVPEWFYPIYLLGYYIYFLMISESYFATKSIMDRFLKRPKLKKIQWIKNPKVALALFLSGIILIIVPTYYYIDFYLKNGGYHHILGTPIELNLNIFPLFLLGFGFWFIFESVAILQNKNSLIKDIARGYYRPLLAIIISCIWYGFLLEVWNYPIQYYSYSNLSYLNPQILNIPIIIIALWPLHYIPFLSLYRIYSEEVFEDPWEIDRIKT